ncbi:MAG: DUF1573 domain-containing protein [Sphingobacteriales bacterium]|nr:MAG: DUF1573 domain-containing protein [Sphingobacteriales bacterium]
MKKVLLSLGVVLLAGSAAMAQHAHNEHDGHNHGTPAAKPVKGAKATAKAPAVTATPVVAPNPAGTTGDVNMLSFNTEEHDFKTVAEGPAAEYEFTFTNKGKEPIIISQVHASCGCTTPTWPKEPILPGKTAAIKASYATTGRPGPFTKNITVLTNGGTKILTIKGNVEKAPETSVPQNTSMLKTN